MPAVFRAYMARSDARSGPNRAQRNLGLLRCPPSRHRPFGLRLVVRPYNAGNHCHERHGRRPLGGPRIELGRFFRGNLTVSPVGYRRGARDAILDQKDVETWLRGTYDDALALQRPYPAERMTVPGRGRFFDAATKARGAYVPLETRRARIRALSTKPSGVHRRTE